MCSYYKSEYIALDAEISEIKDLLSFLSQAKRIKKVGASIFEWKNNESSTISDFLRTKIEFDIVLTNSLYLIAHALFENYVRTLVELSIEYINSQEGKEHSPQMRCRHTKLSGRALSDIDQQLSYQNFDEKEIIHNLYSFWSEGKVILNSKVFSAYLKKITSPDGIEAICDLLDISLNWDDLSRNDILRDIFKTKKSKDTANATKDFLKTMVSNRNRLAHTGGNVSDISLNELEQTLKFINAFADILSNYIAQKI